MTYETVCKCGADVVVEVDGYYIPATMVDPAEYPTAELVSRKCDTVGDDEEGIEACTANDFEVEEYALEALEAERDRGW
jgi:hypothetical protein